MGKYNYEYKIQVITRYKFKYRNTSYNKIQVISIEIQVITKYKF